MSVLHYPNYLPSKIQDQFRSPLSDTVCPTLNPFAENTLIQITCVIFTKLFLVAQQDLSPDSQYLVP